MKHLMTFNNTLFVLLAGLLLILPIWSASVTAAPIKQESDQSCRYFTETTGGQGGYSVTNDDNVSFVTTFNQWGLTKIGFPISGRYMRDGFVTQAFQKGIMQWQPESETVSLVNIFDELHNAGFDDVLYSTRQTPYQLPAGWDGDIPFDEIVKKRQALLNGYPALRDAYFASDAPLTFFGLPTSSVEDMGSHYAIRLQRTVLQEWKIDVPWAKAGDVTIANGADIAKELGGLPEDALIPIAESPCPPPPANDTLPSEEANDTLPSEEAPAAEANDTLPSEEAPPAEEANDTLPSEETPPPAVEPTAVPAPAAQICPANPALVEVSNGLGETLTINLTGPQNTTITLPARSTARYCMTSGTYQFSTQSASYQALSGSKNFSSDYCQCWALYNFTATACTCSNEASDYGPLP